MKEALRYLENAKEILLSASKEDNTYTDIKPVRQACGAAYLAVLKAIDEYLLSQGVDKKRLPKSVDGYGDLLRKYALVHDRRLLREFEKLHDALDIAGYYRGLLADVNMVQDAFKAAEVFITKLG